MRPIAAVRSWMRLVESGSNLAVQRSAASACFTNAWRLKAARWFQNDFT